jgi:hypothetical protein
MSNNRQVRLAIVGGGRGSAYQKSVEVLPEKVELVALCDQNPEVCARWKEQYPGLETYTDFQQILDHPNIDAVLLATPVLLHADQSVQLMRAGKHVLCEVSVAHTIEDCWKLVETVEETGRAFMMAENFCYLRMNLMIKNMAEQNAFGELTYAEAGYIHDVRDAMHRPDGSLLWRGELMRDYNGINYPAHSLGPVSQWLGINRTDSFESMTTIASKPAAQADYFRSLFGEGHPGSKQEFWKQGDSVLSLIRTKGGVAIYLRNDFSSPRPHNYLSYGLQGTMGAFSSGRECQEEPVAWLSAGEPQPAPPRWKPLWDYAPQFEHPAWIEFGETASQVCYLSEFFVLEEFVSAILENRAPAIDVYDSVAISSVFPLSIQSIEQNGQPVQFPDFAKNKPGVLV